PLVLPPPPPSAGSLKPQNIARFEIHAALSRQHHHFASRCFRHRRSPRRARRTALKTPRPEFPSLRQQCHLRRSQQLNLADQSVAAAKLPRASRSRSISVPPNPKRIRILERFNRRV